MQGELGWDNFLVRAPKGGSDKAQLKVRFILELELGLEERDRQFQLKGSYKGTLKGNFRLQGERGRAAWSEAQPPPRFGGRVRFVSKSEPNAAIRMGLGSAGCRKNLVAFAGFVLFCFLFLLLGILV